MVKIKWKIAPEPTGRYKSFEKRGWPFAEYPNDLPVAGLYCADRYHIRKAESGEHAPLEVQVADHSVDPWKWREVKRRFATLQEAKEAVVRVLEQHPHFIPKEFQDGHI